MRVVVIDGKRRLGSPRPLYEEAHRIILGQLLRRRRLLRIGEGEGRHRIFVFAVNVQHDSASHERDYLWRAEEEINYPWSRGRHLLKVVQDEQEVLLAQGGTKTLL